METQKKQNEINNKVNQLKKQASDLRKAGNYSEALLLYEKLWNEYRQNCTAWDGWGYAQCLYKAKNYKLALDVCREVYKIDKDHSANKNLYAWCIFQTEFNQENIQDENTFLKAAEAITKLTSQSDKFSPYINTVFKVIDYFNNKPIPQVDKVLEWLQKLDVEKLSDEPIPINNENQQSEEKSDKNKKQKIKELASDKEKYYMLLIKALYKNGSYEQAIKESEKALKAFDKLHYDNKVWFQRYAALSYSKLGNNNKGLKILTELLKKKNEWFIQRDIAEIYFAQKDYSNALNYAIDGILNFGDDDKKIDLYLLLAKLFELFEETLHTKTIIEFVVAIRKSKGWKIDNELQQFITKYNINTNDEFNIKKLKKNIEQILEFKKYENQQLYEGIICQILPNNKAGFIETENKEKIYFMFNEVKGPKELIQVGRKVKFYVVEGFDKKKNQPSKNAINIKFCE